MEKVFEINFDSLVGPTHNYSGLARDNPASVQNQSLVSNPQEAALQGLQKMKYLADLGIPQAILPPHPRPLIQILQNLGFQGTPQEILKTAQKEAPQLLSAISSASYMWAANAATVTPSLDSLDKKLHITPANLISSLHRTLEVPETTQILKKIFKNSNDFLVHPPLYPSASLADEGAANHTRLCPTHNTQGLHFFVYGRTGLPHIPPPILPKIHYPRQTLEASQAIARIHQIPLSHLLFAQQNPEAIDAGVFHNDVICVGNKNILLYHEQAFLNTPQVIQKLKTLYHTLYHSDLLCIEVPTSQIPLQDAIKSYLFNSQLITTPQNKTILLTPSECLTTPSTQKFLNTLPTLHPEINEFQPINVHQSMQNGGGPACLRLRVVVTDHQLQSLPQSLFLTNSLFNTLTQWIQKQYRTHLHPNDLADIHLHQESQTALQELYEILQI